MPKSSSGPRTISVYVGSAPGLLYGGCHGGDERQVFEELCHIVDEVIELYRVDGKPLPPATSGRDIANRVEALASSVKP